MNESRSTFFFTVNGGDVPEKVALDAAADMDAIPGSNLWVRHLVEVQRELTRSGAHSCWIVPNLVKGFVEIMRTDSEMIPMILASSFVSAKKIYFSGRD